METLGVLEARRRLPELLRRAGDGEETLISRHGRPVAALVPLEQRHRPLRQALLSLEGSGSRIWSPPAATRNASPDASDDARRGSPAKTPPSQEPPVPDPPRWPRGAGVALDASVLVPWLRGDCHHRRRGARRPDRLQAEVVEAIALGHWRGVLSMATLAGLLRAPLRRGEAVLAARYRAVFTDPAGWTLVPVSAELLEAAVALEQAAGLSPADALEVASALQGGAVAMISRHPHRVAALPQP